MSNIRILKHLASLVAVAGLFILAVGSTNGGGGGSKSSSAPSSSTVHLNATVSFNGTQFVISNIDSFDWTDVELDVNSKTFSRGYTLRTSVIKAGEVYTVGAMQFADSDGEKFNPFTHKPLNLTILCDTPKGKGAYGVTWQ